jgi:hypothetical protein
MTITEFTSVIESQAFDESKHVNYTLGMLLSKEDFQQEFAYLLGRDKRLARQAAGYGTLVGLRVSLDTTDAVKGARVVVDPGSALTPRGLLVCVRPGQCAYLNEWLTAKRTSLERAGVVVPGSVTASIVLGYRDCPTDNVLLPGSPCRDEDEMKIPSRVEDSFLLELRTTPPLQNEELAIIDFVAWLRQVAVGGGAPTTLADFEAAVANAGQIISSPPESPQSPGMTRLHFDPPPASLTIDPAAVADYLRAAFRVWTTTLRPRVHSLCCGGQGCCVGNRVGVAEPEDLLLLGTVTMPVTADWTVDLTQTSSPPTLPPLRLDETSRPTLLHTRMLQELANLGGSSGPPSPVAPPLHRVVAAGLINTPGSVTIGGLAGASTAPGKLKLQFTGYQDPRSSPPSFTYVVKAMTGNTVANNPTAAFDSFDVDGIVLNITKGAALVPAATINTTPFMIEVSRVG